MSRKSRILLYCYYDKNGLVTDDTYCLLKAFRTVANYIVVVVNGEQAKNNLTEFCDQLYFRRNEGYDLRAYKYVLEKRK